MTLPKRLTFLGIITLLSTVTWLVYRPGLHGPFVFDDLTNILLVKSTYLKNLDFASFQNAAWSVDSGPLKRPIAILSFALNYYFTQLDVYWFKLTNLIIHILTGIALYHLTYRTIAKLAGDPETEKNDQNITRYLSLAACALWLVHPLNLTAVLYVVQRMTSLASLFMVLGMVGYVIGRQKLIDGSYAGYVIILTAVICFGTLAIFTKEIGALFPLYLILIEIYIFRLASSEKLRHGFKILWYSVFILPLVLVACYAALNAGALFGLDNYQFRNFTLAERVLTESRILWFYLKLILLPSIAEMGTYHDDIAISTGLLQPVTTLLSVSGLLLLVLIAIFGRKKHPVLSFGIAWFLVGHSLESSIVPLELAHEHRNYLPDFGILLILTYYTAHTAKKISGTIKLRYLFLFGYFCLLSTITYARATEWRDEWTLFNTEVRNHPNSARSHTSMAVLYNDNKLYKEAGEHFQIAADLQRKELDYIIRLANFELNTKGKITDAVLKELDHRIQTYNYTSVALWLFENLLNGATNNPEQHLRLVGLYEKLAHSPSVTHDWKWQLATSQRLAENYEILGLHEKAIEYYLQSADLQPIAYYYIKSAIHYALLGNVDSANKMISTVADKRLSLTNTDQKLLAELETILKRKHQSPRKPAGSQNG